MYSRMVAPADPVPLRGGGRGGGGGEARWGAQHVIGLMREAVLQGMWERTVLSVP
jgi:hypothetical protein